MGSAMDAPAAQAQARLKAGDWTVEPDLNRLAMPGTAVRIEPRVMSLLLHLADRPGEVATREELLSAIGRAS